LKSKEKRRRKFGTMWGM